MSQRAEMLAQLESAIEYGRQRREGLSPVPPNTVVPDGYRVAIVGGISYHEGQLEDFLLKLHQKRPHCIIITGQARGAERAVKTQMEAWGHTVYIPPIWLNEECQVNDILLHADAIVTVGSITGGRARLAAEIHARLTYKRNSSGGILKEKGKPVPFVEPHNIRPFHNVAAPERKATTTKRKVRTQKQKQASLA